MAATVDQKLLKQTKFPLEFNHKVDMRKVNIEVMKRWITRKISEILGTDDDIITELCFNLLDGERYPNIKVLQIQLTGFLEKDTAAFCKELWSLCLSAQASPQGVPKELLEAKKQEIMQEKKLEAEKAAEQARRRRQNDEARDRELDAIRRAERGERSRARWRGSRGGRGEYDFTRRSFRRSPSPHSDGQYHAESHRSRPLRGDSYVPQVRESRDTRRGRSPSASRSLSIRSRSRTPPRRYSPPRRRRTLSRSRSPTRGGRYVPAHSRSHSRERKTRRGNIFHKKPSSLSRKRDMRSPSPRRHHHRSPSRSLSRGRLSSRSRSPPSKRHRQRYSASSSHSPSSPPHRRGPHSGADNISDSASLLPRNRSIQTHADVSSQFQRNRRSLSKGRSASPVRSIAR